jgi:hypothetical protein
MTTENLDDLLDRIKAQGPAAQQAVVDIFAEILKRFESDLLMLTSFIPKNKAFMQNLGGSLALSSQWYLRVLGYKAVIQGWGDNWKDFITKAFALYHTKFMDLYHTVEGIFEFLKEKEGESETQTSVAANLPKSDIDALDAKLQLHKERYQILTGNFASFYAELLAEFAKLQASRKPKSD